MNFLAQTKQELAVALSAIFQPATVSADDFTAPPNPAMGDLALPLFSIARQLGTSPGELGSRAVSGLRIAGVSGLAVNGPYLNFHLDKNYFAEKTVTEIESAAESFGMNNDGGGRRAVIEFANVNTHKELHIGHLRNFAYGDSMVRIMAANGYEVVPVSYVNDFGIHTAKTIWALEKYYQDQPIPENKGFFLGKVYQRACQEIEKQPEAIEEVKAIMQDVEARQGEAYLRWQETRQWSIDQFASAYKEMGISFDRTFYESEFIDEGRALVHDLSDKGIVKLSEGATIADLSDYDLGVLVVLRSDGTATYPVADIPLAQAKEKIYNPDLSVLVVDARQALYFKQLNKICELYGLKTQIEHLGYEAVALPEGAMSSRKGLIIIYEDLKRQLSEKSLSETMSRHGDWPETRVSEVIRKVVFGAMRFEMLKVGSLSPITFDINKALAFSGFTAAYLQYTCARISSLGAKVGEVTKGKMDIREAKEAEVVMKIAQYGEAVRRAGERRDPSEIARFIFEVAQVYNDFYHLVPVAKAEGEAKNSRLRLSLAVRQVISNGLQLLGIEEMEEM